MAAKKDQSTHDLTAPDGTHVTVTGEARRDALIGRGYAKGHKKASTESTTGDKK